MRDLTIVIPTKDESDGLPSCLESIGRDFANRVVAVDSNSTDVTCGLARALGADVIPYDWNGQFPKKRNWFLRQHTPSTQWVMFLDADEHLTPAFKRELAATLPSTQHAGFWLHYTINAARFEIE